SKHYWYEVILADRGSPAVVKDSRISWIAKPSQRGRVFRGKTSAGRKIRGLRHKGKGAENLRPSKDANN
ncbi:MAG: 50S ribosomal protein L15e, partial [Candidatus Woesearchaeota archaeon]